MASTSPILAEILPPIPPYEGLHPIVVHFPIALLSIAPVFVLLAAVWKSQTRSMLAASLVLCVLGTAFAFLALSTGEATEQFAEAISAAKATLHEHEELAEMARNLFIGITILLGVATLIVWRVHDRLKPAGRWIGTAVLLAAFAFPLITLANAAHEGGKLVHLYGVRAPLAGSASIAAEPSTPGAVTPATPPSSPGKEVDDD